MTAIGKYLGFPALFSSNYHLFVGLHTLLLGLFPFYLPVFLMKQGVGFSGICLTVGWTGVGFCLTLCCFDRLRSGFAPFLVYAGLLAEFCLVFLLAMGASPPILGLANGCYACLYWTMQRILFMGGGSQDNSGRRFGNFQIYVMVVLKLAIIIGAVVLEHYGVAPLVVVSGVLCLGGGWFFRRTGAFTLPRESMTERVLGWKQLIRFRDSHRSRMVFAVDGIFLYLESYFWLISLYLVAGENFVRLGGLVVLLAAGLGVIFSLIKNRIDAMGVRRLYRLAVVLYALSWLMRGSLEGVTGGALLLPYLLLIAFFTSLFRLAFNKRFFDIGLSTCGYRYLFHKSYWSQAWLALFFLLLGSGSYGTGTETVVEILRWLYLGAGCCGLVYLGYRPPLQSGKS